MLMRNIVPTLLKIICKILYMVKCYDKANMGVCALSVWEIFSWGLTYFDLGPEFQCLLKVKEELNSVLIFQNAKNNVSN